MQDRVVPHEARQPIHRLPDAGARRPPHPGTGRLRQHDQMGVVEPRQTAQGGDQGVTPLRVPLAKRRASRRAADHQSVLFLGQQGRRRHPAREDRPQQDRRAVSAGPGSSQPPPAPQSPLGAEKTRKRQESHRPGSSQPPPAPQSPLGAEKTRKRQEPPPRPVHRSPHRRRNPHSAQRRPASARNPQTLSQASRRTGAGGGPRPGAHRAREPGGARRDRRSDRRSPARAPAADGRLAGARSAQGPAPPHQHRRTRRFEGAAAVLDHRRHPVHTPASRRNLHRVAARPAPAAATRHARARRRSGLAREPVRGPSASGANRSSTAAISMRRASPSDRPPPARSVTRSGAPPPMPAHRLTPEPLVGPVGRGGQHPPAPGRPRPRTPWCGRARSAAPRRPAPTPVRRPPRPAPPRRGVAVPSARYVPAPASRPNPRPSLLDARSQPHHRVPLAVGGQGDAGRAGGGARPEDAGPALFPQFQRQQRFQGRRLEAATLERTGAMTSRPPPRSDTNAAVLSICGGRSRSGSTFPRMRASYRNRASRVAG